LQIINNKDFQIELQVFERDIHNITLNQKIDFDCTIPESKKEKPYARIIQIGNRVDPQTKTFKVLAKPEKCYQRMRHGILVNALIHLNDQDLQVLPEQAIISRMGESDFIFLVQSDTIYQKKEVQTGLHDQGFVEIKTQELLGKTVVTKGANYIAAEMESEE